MTTHPSRLLVACCTKPGAKGAAELATHNMVRALPWKRAYVPFIPGLETFLA